MLTRASIKTLVATLIIVSYSVFVSASQLIPADNKGFVYSGRIDFSQPTAPSLSWPGSSIKANFSGSYLAIVLDDQKGKNFFNVIVDGDDSAPYVLEAKQGEHRYIISQVLADKSHSLEIYKRTEGEEGATQFKGLELADKAALLSPPKRLTRRMEIYGDSITSGMGNEGADNGVDNLLAEKNNYLAYGAIAARELNAELHTISQSGIGVMISWFDFIMPQFYNQLSAVGNYDSQWDFTQWTPDVVLVNLMQNDSWLIDRDLRLQPIPDDEQRIAHYQDFIATIRQKYPNAYIICALGSMDATKTEKWPNYIRSAVTNLKDLGDPKLDTLFFDFSGYGQHPRVAQHKSNAKKLAVFVRKKMHWD
jgi:hypothetical protein